MKKQPLVLSLALAFSFFTALVGAPNSAYAGKFVVPGTSPDSATSIGDKTVVPGTSPDSATSIGESFVPAPNVDVQIQAVVDTKPVLSVREERQAQLDQVIANIVGQPAHPSIKAFLNGQENSVAASETLKNAILSLEVSPAKVDALVNALSGLIGETQNVDINRLNDAVNAYNEILNESSPEVLLALASNPESAAISTVLKELRLALTQS
ncbi:MAG: hypothetical protein EA343_11340 [Nodularia sp. (in: Bacteria)]|nr:MAG: hypothetical protein EA343_11340 [Nodularia sp. (in: cyanobacteria)]